MAAVADLSAELATPPFPVSLHYLWKTYFRLRRRKSPGFSGPNKIEWPDLDAFVRLTGFHFTRWEVEVIADIDDLFCRAMAEAADGTATEIATASTEALGRAGKRHVVVRKGGP